ncbi:MAG TPA: hypothetical protein VGD91_25655, partial [Trebonia sp.]
LFVPKINPLALAVTGLLLAGIVWALLAGNALIKGALAVALVWVLLIGGLRIVVVHNTSASDAFVLSGYTWIPRVVWFVIWRALFARVS